MANTITTRITLQGGKELEKLLKQLGITGSEAFKDIQTAADKVKGPPAGVENRIKKLTDSFKGAGESITKFGQSVVGVGRSLSLIGAGVAGAIAGLVALAKSGGDAADAMQRNAEAAGLTIDEYAKLSFAAEQAEVSTEEFGVAMNRLNSTIDDAIKGNAKAAGIFRTLNVELEQGGKLRPTIDIVTDLVAAFNKLPDGARKSALAIDIFGRGGARLIPFLNTTNEELAEMFSQVERLGLGFTKAEAEIGDKFGDTLNLLRRGVTALKDHIGVILAGALQPLLETFVTFLEDNQQAIRDFVQNVVDAFAALPAPVQQAITAFAGIVIVLGPIIIALGLFIQLIGFAVSGLALLGPVFVGLGTAMSGIVGVLTTVIGLIGTFIATIGGVGIAIAAVVAGLVLAAILIVQNWDTIVAFVSSAAATVLRWLQTIVAYAAQAAQAIVDFFLSIPAQVSAGFLQVLAGARVLVEGIVNLFKSIGAGILRAMADVVARASAAAEAIADAFTGAFDSLWQTAKSVTADILRWLSDIIARASRAAEAIADAATGGGRARGGYVQGPGTSTSDSIPARLSAGEYVIKAAAVRKYGVSLFSALNGMRIAAREIGMNMGGLVTAPLAPPRMRFATGGLVTAPVSGDGRAFTLVLDGERFGGLRAPDSTAEDLIRFAKSRAMRSAGKKPDWYGGGR